MAQRIIVSYAEELLNELLPCWMDIHVNSPDIVAHDDNTNFIARRYTA